MNLTDPKRFVRNTYRQARRARLVLAERQYQAAARLRPDEAEWWFRLGRAREARRDWAGAEQAYAAAVTISPDTAHYHARLGRVAKARQAWTTSAEHYRKALELGPARPVWTRALATALVKSGDLATAVGALDAALECSPNRAPLLRSLADVAEGAGRWDRAAAALTELLDLTPGDLELRYRLTGVLERRHTLPLPPGAPAGARADRSVFEKAVAHLEYLVEHYPRRVHAPYRLGLLHERDGDPAAAAAAYRTALERLDDRDAHWVHNSRHQWRFRLAYLARRHEDLDVELPPTPAPDDPRLDRTVCPVPFVPAQAAAQDGPDAPTGFFEYLMDAQGLHLAGFLPHGTTGSVAVEVDGHPLRRVMIDTDAWLPAFKYQVCHEVLDEFPERAVLTLSHDGRRLVTLGGANALRVRVPGGTDGLGERRAAGVVPAKWGRWPMPPDEQAKRVPVYERTKEVLEERTGRRLFLNYGTLLGHHRDGGFIPGDDDFDASFVVDSTKPADLKTELQDIALELLDGGLDLCFAQNGRMFKAGYDGIYVDILPIWFHKGRAWAFDVHRLPREAFEPALPATFQGRPVYVPADTEAFLADNYGPDWRTPRSDFRYYRDKADYKLLSRTWLSPKEVRAFAERAEKVRAANPGAGRFVGLEIPGAEPGFW